MADVYQAARRRSGEGGGCLRQRCGALRGHHGRRQRLSRHRGRGRAGKMTDTVGKDTTAGLATAADAEYEVLHGVSFVGLNALIMQRYMYEFDVPPRCLRRLQHQRPSQRRAQSQRHVPGGDCTGGLPGAPVIATPINIMDSSPVCDGSAVVVLAPTEWAHKFTTGHHRGRADPGQCQRQRHAGRTRSPRPALLAGGQHQQPESAAPGRHRAGRSGFLRTARCIHDHDGAEPGGEWFARRGEGWRLAHEGEIGIGGRPPISTMGGLKSRGHPVGATGVYQIVESAATDGWRWRQSGSQCPAGYGAEYRRQRCDHRDAHPGQQPALVQSID